MTPKEKALYLIKKADDCVCGDINKKNTKYMVSLICDEIIDQFKAIQEHEIEEGMFFSYLYFWNEVKKEVEKL